MSTTVPLAQGRIAGIESDGVRAFFAIPYAGDLGPRHRLEPPRPAPTWSGVRPATEAGPTAPQNPYGPPYSSLFVDRLVPGDGALNLNVWAPADADGAAVLVWIHGGAFAHGSGVVPQYDGSAFARSGVVCVTINYRLGLEGFLDLGDEDVANVGLLDQIAALRWVRENIAAFGGDPGRVTVAGQSAGAMSIGALLSSPAAAGLFGAAILQSGAAHHALSRDSAQRIAHHVAAELGVAATREGLAEVDTQDALRVLAALETEIQTQPDPARWGEVAATMMPFMPTVDGTVLPRRPIEAIADGAARGVALLIGTNTDENRLFLAPSGVIGHIDEAMLGATITGHGFDDPSAVAELYTDPDDPSPGTALAALLTDWMFRIPAIRLAEAQAATGSPAWMYEFAWRSTALDGSLGASHSVELPFVFDTLDSEGAELLTGPDAPRELASRVHAHWVRFVQTHEAAWPTYTPQARNVRVFDTTDTTTVDPRGEQRRVWTGLR